MSSTESSSAPETPPSSHSTPDISVRAVIALPSLELTASYSPDDDAVKKLHSLVRQASQRFDEAFSPEVPFDFVDCKPYPELNSDEQAISFRQALPQGQHDMAIVIKPGSAHGSILERLKATIEAERKQHRLIVEEMEATVGTSKSVSARKKGKNTKTTGLSTPLPATNQHDDLRRQFDQRISALERDNVELKRDNVELKRDNVELKKTVDHHWTSLSALSRRALLDNARLTIVSEFGLSLTTLRDRFRQDSQLIAETLCERLRAESKGTLSPRSMKMIFGVESAPASGQAAPPQTIRKRGNAAAHQLNDHDALCAVLQGDLMEYQRASLIEIYTFVFGEPPTFTV